MQGEKPARQQKHRKKSYSGLHLECGSAMRYSWEKKDGKLGTMKI